MDGSWHGSHISGSGRASRRRWRDGRPARALEGRLCLSIDGANVTCRCTAACCGDWHAGMCGIGTPLYPSHHIGSTTHQIREDPVGWSRSQSLFEHIRMPLPGVIGESARQSAVKKSPCRGSGMSCFRDIKPDAPAMF
ncbi:hypothetical protein D8I24_7001 [Cupriavidus necator H850]|nr:hypothetical protein D8I24_7001 [Cupriavidus necator H850]